jgi:CheY-like chemotaxis protein
MPRARSGASTDTGHTGFMGQGKSPWGVGGPNVMTVMIVDDSAEMRHLLRDVVAPLTREVVECVDGQECLDRFPACLPDWTIMDVRMPRLDGLSATREVHARWPLAKVLIVTHFRFPGRGGGGR